MKKQLALILIITIVVSLAGAIPAFAEKQYISNGDFQNGNFPSGWSAADGISVACDDNGNYYANLKSETGSIYMSSPWYNLQPGDRVTLEFDLKIVSLKTTASTESAASSACISVAFGGKQSDGSLKTIEKKLNYNFYEHHGEWVHYKYDFLIPDNSYGISFLFRLMRGGEICYDNISLKNSNNKTTLRVAYGDLELDRLPDGINTLKAKLHYVSESEATENGNLIFAAYSGESLCAIEIEPFSTSGSIYKEVTLSLPEGAKDISVKAYVWKNGQTPTPIAASELLPKEGRSEAFDRFVTERMRAAYGASTMFYQDKDGDGKYEVMDRLLEAGINTFIFQIHYDRKGTPVDQNPVALENAIKDLADFADETGSMIFAKFNYGTNAAATMSNYDMYHPGCPNSRKVVCPLAEGYWKDAMQRRMEIAAKYPQITGVVFDMEMYNGTGTRYNDPCFCDTCVAKFAQKHPSDAANNLVSTTANSRLEFTRVNSIFTDYKNWQAGEITGIVSKIREHLHAINPDLILATMPGYDWLDGLIKGLGTEKMPTLILEEGSYEGNIAGNHKIIATMENDGVHAVLSSGLYPSETEAIKLANFAAKVSEAGMVNVGYWIYAIQYLESDLDYYPELKKGNEALDAVLGLD